jgi:N-glycosylase/DNA lyase
MRIRLVFDVYVEEYAVHWVMGQFGLLQTVPVPVAPRLPPTTHR